MFRAALSCARPSFMLPIFARESLRAASSDWSLLSSRQSSVFLLSAWREESRSNRCYLFKQSSASVGLLHHKFI